MGKQGDNGLSAQMWMLRMQMSCQLLRATIGMLDHLYQNGDGFGSRRQPYRGGGNTAQSLLTGCNSRVGSQIEVVALKFLAL